MIPLIDIGFLSIRIWDILDIIIVGILFYQLYKLLRGSIAFNIFIGIILLYIVWWLVNALKMDLLSLLLGQFVSLGVIMLLIVFQPEIRRFLLLLGNTTLQRNSKYFNRLFRAQEGQSEEKAIYIKEIKAALIQLSKTKTGALIIFANNLSIEMFSHSGIQLNANISQSLLESIFNKESPLHDGAVIISEDKIKTASCVLPLSSSTNLPYYAGLRHRAGVGVSENINAAAFIVSEETGYISFAYQGNFQYKLDENQLSQLLIKHYN